MGEENFLQALMTAEYLKAMKWSITLGLNGMDYCEKVFARLVSLPQEIQNPFFNFSLVLIQS